VHEYLKKGFWSYPESFFARKKKNVQLYEKYVEIGVNLKTKKLIPSRTGGKENGKHRPYQ